MSQADLQRALETWRDDGNAADLERAVRIGRALLDASGGSELRGLVGQLVLAGLDHLPRRIGGSVRDAASHVAIAGTAAMVDPSESLAVGFDPAWSGPPARALAVVDDAVRVLEHGADRDDVSPVQLTGLADGLMARYRTAGAVADLRRAVSLLERVRAVVPADPLLDHATCHALVELGTAYGDRDVLDRAVAIGDGLLESGLDFVSKVVLVDGLVQAHRARYDLCFDDHDLWTAVAICGRVVEQIGDEHDLTPHWAHLVGTLWLRSYRQSGSARELHDALYCLRLAAQDDRSPEKLADLADALLLRAHAEQDDNAGNEASDVARAAAGLLASGHPMTHRVLYAHGRALAATVEAATSGDLLGTAVLMLRLALSALPHAHPWRPRYLDELADVWTSRFELSGALPDLSGALEASRAAYCASVDGDPSRPVQIATYARGMTVVHGVNGDVELLRRGILLYRQALDNLPASHPFRAEVLYRTAQVLIDLADLDATDDRAQSRVAARAMVDEAVDITVGRASTRARAAVVSSYLAATEDLWPEAALAALRALLAVRELTGPQLTRDLAEARAAEYGGLAGWAAACAVQAGVPDAAVENLELGRGVLLSQQIDLAALDAAAHASRSAEIGGRLSALLADRDRTAEVLEEMGRVDSGWLPKRAADASRGFRESHEQLWRFLEENAETIPGPLGGAVPRFDEIRPHADQGPLVLLNLHEHRADALIVRSGGVTVVPLGCSVDQAGQWVEALSANPDRETVAGIQEWLWHTVVGPVLHELGTVAREPGDPRAPRMWWLPTGLLSMLPLHAAGIPGGENALEHVVSSYSPTAKVLIQSRRAAAPGANRQAAIALRHTPSEPDRPLPFTGDEVADIARRAPGARTLVDDEATAQRVLDVLAASTRVHVACHSVSDPGSPSSGGLLLHDRTLTVAEIARLRLRNADFAYLSACSTARPGPGHLDEAVHLASAFQAAGFRDVVGTLWPLRDRLGALVCRAFYDELAAGALPALALHRVAARVRAARPHDPAAWAAFVHAGR